jgi:hypothetical protein
VAVSSPRPSPPTHPRDAQAVLRVEDDDATRRAARLALELDVDGELRAELCEGREGKGRGRDGDEEGSWASMECEPLSANS